MALRKTSPLFIAIIVLIGVLVGVGVLFHPRREVHVKTDPRPDEKAIKLLNEHRPVPLEEIQKAVKESGRGVDGSSWRGWSLLCFAVGKRRGDIAEWVLAQGANPNGIEVDLPAIEPHPPLPLSLAIARQDLRMVKLLLKWGADPDLCVKGDVSPRNLAKQLGNREIIAALPPNKKKTGMTGGHAAPIDRSRFTSTGR